MMTDIEKFLSTAREFIRCHGYVPTAQKAKLARGTLRNWRKHNWNPTAETIRKLQTVIPIDWESEQKDDAA